MRARFIHAADIHLGYEQYNLIVRANDFARAYMAMVDHAIGVHADFVVLSGDLFHRSSADAWMLRQATSGLTALRTAGIPVLAIEGNHDVQHARKHLSWMEYLCDEGLLCLLDLEQADNGRKILRPWNDAERRGSWIDVAGVRVYGLKYYGAITGRILEEVGGDIQPGPNDYTVLMLHAGMQGQVPHLHGGLTVADLAPVQPAVDYLALGHVHKRLVEGWIFNPGSLETNSTEEMEWPHGFFDVQVDTEASEKQVITSVETPGLRPFRRISMLADDARSVDDFVEAAESAIAATSGVPEGAVIELHLGGTATFKRQEVPVERLKGSIEVRFNPLTVRLRNNLVPPGVVTVKHGERMKRADLEREIVEQLVYQQGEYRDHAAAWTRLILDVKNMAVEKDLPASIADHVQAALASLNDATPPPVSGPQCSAEEILEGGEPPCMAHLFEDW